MIHTKKNQPRRWYTTHGSIIEWTRGHSTTRALTITTFTTTTTYDSGKEWDRGRGGEWGGGESEKDERKWGEGKWSWVQALII